MKKVFALALCVFFLSSTMTPYAHAASQAWESKLDNALSWNTVTGFGTLLVGSNASLASYNPQTGEKLWIREDLKKLAPFDVREIDGFPILVISQDQGMGGMKSVVEALDMASGLTLWKTETMQGAPLGIYPVAGKPVAVFFSNEAMNKEQAGIYVQAYNVQTGEQIWRTLFTKEIKSIPFHLVDNAGAFYSRVDLSGYQDPIVEGNIAYVSFGGLTALDVDAGKILWEVPFKPAHKTYKKAYAAPVIDGDVVYATGGGVVYAVEKATGKTLWQSEKVKSGLIVQVVAAPEMVIARIGGNFYNPGSKKLELDKPLKVVALNKASGAVLWEYDGARGGITNLVYLPQNNSVLFADAKNLIAIDTRSTGEVKEAFKLPLQFKRSIGAADMTSTGVKALTGGIGGLIGGAAKLAKGKEREDPPIAVIPQANGLVVVRGQQHILAFDPAKQETVWSLSFQSPGGSALGIALVAAVSAIATLGYQAQYAAGQSSMSGASENIKNQFRMMDRYLDKRYSKSQSGERYAYILTNVEENSEKGIGIAAIDLQTGDTADQFILRDKNPEYAVDEMGGRVYYFKGKKQIVAYDMQ